MAAFHQPAGYVRNQSSISLINPFSKLADWLTEPSEININRINGVSICVPARGERNYQVGEIIGDSLFYLRDKPFGVEPGFLAVPIDENLIKHLHKFSSESTLTVNAKEALVAYLSENSSVAKDFATWLRDKYQSNEIEDAAMWLFKQDYDDPVFTRNNVAPRDSRLAKTNAVQGNKKHGEAAESVSALVKLKRFLTLKAYSFYKNMMGDRTKENANAILECLATDVAQTHGMLVQSQGLTFSRYGDGFLKIMTHCKWESGLRVFQDCLAGDEGHQKYLLKVEGYNTEDQPVFAQSEKDKRRYSEDSIIDLGFNLALLITENDRDAIGSTGQNKGKIKNRLFGFDFGQAYRKKNTIVNTLSDDFSFAQSTGEDFIKNISMFYDTPLSERMTGIFFLYQISDQATRDENFNSAEQEKIQLAIEAYKTSSNDFSGEFKERIENIKPGAEEEKFAAYVASFEKFATEAKKNNDQVAADLFKEYAIKITAVKENAKAARVKMLQVFKERMQLNSQEVDLLDNLEKLTSKTSLLSNDGSVILNHLRILPDQQSRLPLRVFGIRLEPNRVRWSMEKTEESVKLSSAKMSAKKAQKIMTILKAYLAENPALNEYITMNLEKDKKAGINFILKCPQAQFAKVLAIFREESVIAYKHKIEEPNHPAEHPVIRDGRDKKIPVSQRQTEPNKRYSIKMVAGGIFSPVKREQKIPATPQLPVPNSLLLTKHGFMSTPGSPYNVILDGKGKEVVSNHFIEVEPSIGPRRLSFGSPQ